MYNLLFNIFLYHFKNSNHQNFVEIDHQLVKITHGSYFN